MGLRDVGRRLSKYPVWVTRLAIGSSTSATPTKAPLYIQPTAEPTAGVVGDIYVDATGAMFVHNGTDWKEVTYVA